MYSTQTLQKAVEKLALQNLLLLDQVDELEKKVEFYRAMTLPKEQKLDIPDLDHLEVKPDANPY